MVSANPPVHLVVDLAGLDALRGHLLDLRAELAAAAAVTVQGDVGQCGDGAVADAVDGFVAGWRDGRERIGEKIDRLAVLLQTAIETYRGAEAGLTAAAGGGH